MRRWRLARTLPRPNRRVAYVCRVGRDPREGLTRTSPWLLIRVNGSYELHDTGRMFTGISSCFVPFYSPGTVFQCADTTPVTISECHLRAFVSSLCGKSVIQHSFGLIHRYRVCITCGMEERKEGLRGRVSGQRRMCREIRVRELRV